MPHRFVVSCSISLVAACASDGVAPESTTSASAGGTASAGGEAGAAGEANASLIEFVSGPRFATNDNEAAPLVGRVSFRTNMAALGSLEVQGGGENWELPLDAPSTHHEKAIVGLKPDTRYQVIVKLHNDDTALTSGPISWRTAALPADFPELKLVHSEPLRMEPGMTLFDARLRRYLVVVDAQGAVRWFYRAAHTTTGHRLSSNGHLLFVQADRELVEIDWLGNTLASWYAAQSAEPYTPSSGSLPVPVPVFRHTVFEMPNGNLLTLSDDLRTIEDYPTSDTDPDAATRSAEVRGDVLVELTREGEVFREISLLDLLDPTRVGHDSVGPGVQDWGHCNAVAYDLASNAYLVSSRHQDAVFKIDRETESLIWILGNHANWREPWSELLLTPTGDDFAWSYHQHAVEVVEGGVGLFDNGNYGVPAYQEPLPTVFSRAVRYSIDEEQMTVARAWSHVPMDENGPLHANAMGDADWQPQTGNVLITSGTLQTDDDPPRVWVQLLEVSSDGAPVFELRVKGHPDSSLPNTSTFEADRIPDIRFIEAR